MNPSLLNAEILALTAEQKALKASAEKEPIRREVLLAESSLAALQSREILDRVRSSTSPEPVANGIYGKCKSVLRQCHLVLCNLRARLCGHRKG